MTDRQNLKQRQKMTKEEKAERALRRRATKPKLSDDKVYSLEELAALLPCTTLEFYKTKQPILALEKDTSAMYGLDQANFSRMIHGIPKGILGDTRTARQLYRHRVEHYFAITGQRPTFAVHPEALVAELECAIPISEIISSGITPGLVVFDKDDQASHIAVHSGLSPDECSSMKIVLSNPFDGDLTGVVEVDPLDRTPIKKSKFKSAKKSKQSAASSERATAMAAQSTDTEEEVSKPNEDKEKPWEIRLTEGHLIDESSLCFSGEPPELKDFSDVQKGVFCAETYIARKYNSIKDFSVFINRIPGFGSYDTNRHWLRYGCIVIFLKEHDEVPPHSFSATRPIEGLEPEEILRMHRKACEETGNGALITAAVYNRIKKLEIEDKTEPVNDVEDEKKISRKVHGAVSRAFEREPDFALDAFRELCEEYPEIRHKAFELILEIEPSLLKETAR